MVSNVILDLLDYMHIEFSSPKLGSGRFLFTLVEGLAAEFKLFSLVKVLAVEFKFNLRKRGEKEKLLHTPFRTL